MSTLVIVGHPDLTASNANAALAAAAIEVDGVTVHDLYGTYPDGEIDVAAEQARVEDHEHLVLQFPLYWYSSPALLKAWQDDVLTMGWAYNPLDPAGTGLLGGKSLSCAITTGAPASEYGPGGWNGVELVDFLLPFAGTAHFCGLAWTDPFVVYGAFGMSEAQIATETARYQDWLSAR